MTSTSNQNDTDSSNKLASVAFQDALEDVHTRFLLNLPDSELSTADRIFFQLEQAWWFYEDLICDPQPELNLPRFPTFKEFALILFEYSPLLVTEKFNGMWNQFTEYKRKISGYGCILLSSDCTKMILCQVWDGKAFMLPAGKINQGENGADAAARETYEETGFHPQCKDGLTAEWKETNPSMVTWTTQLKEEDLLVHTADNGKRRNCYVVVGVPENFPFEPVARKEVQNIDWYPIEQIPKPSFGVLPFIGKLKNWIRKHKKAERARSNVKSRKKTPKKMNQSRGRGNSTPRATPPRVQPTGILTKPTETPQAATVQSPQPVPTSKLLDSFEENSHFIESWVENLPKPQPTKNFGTFRLDADELWRNAERTFQR